MNNILYNWRDDAQIRYCVVYYRRFAYLPVKVHNAYIWLTRYYYSEVQYFSYGYKSPFKVEHNSEIAPHLTAAEYLIYKLHGRVIEKQ